MYGTDFGMAPKSGRWVGTLPWNELMSIRKAVGASLSNGKKQAEGSGSFLIKV